MIFELGPEHRVAHVTKPSLTEVNSTMFTQIAQLVASTNRILNISDLRFWLNEHPDIESNEDIESISTILCMPIINGQKKVIGVAQLINKVSTILPSLAIQMYCIVTKIHNRHLMII